jgi:hypothetical protein
LGKQTSVVQGYFTIKKQAEPLYAKVVHLIFFYAVAQGAHFTVYITTKKCNLITCSSQQLHTVYSPARSFILDEVPFTRTEEAMTDVRAHLLSPRKLTNLK